MSPEEKKMLDSMGVKMPSTKGIPKFTDKQLADAWEEDTRLVPKKNVAAIAAIPATPTTAALPAFVSNVHNAVTAKLSASEKADAETLYKNIKQQPGITVANASIGFWLGGMPMLATWLMGRACQDEPQNIDHLNNYAAMLSMNGAEHIALPLLNNLNKRYPKNSTVLNNIGQAWFGLGDIDKAGRYLDSAILIYAYHSQANNTKSKIEESKGNTQAAVEALMRSAKKTQAAQARQKIVGQGCRFSFSHAAGPVGTGKICMARISHVGG
jgi:tetratricopeptide (TPR) repeat protein